ncbi:MAG: OadG family protein [Proteocatella sp.]
MNELIKQMATDTSSMSLAEKMMGGLVVTVFSMAIVFLVLMLIMYIIKLMTSSTTKVAERRAARVVNEKTEEVKIQEISIEPEENNEEEVVAAIMAAINSYYASSHSKIVIKNISKKEDSTWVNAGILNQINSRL